MANRRMFARSITETDAFLDMPASTRALYFHLGMNADDDGVVDSPKRTMRTSSATDDDLRVLISKGYVIPFDTGIVVVRHWKVNNNIQRDRYHPTIHQAEFSQLGTSETGEYVLPDESNILAALPACIQDVSRVDTQSRLGKDSLGKSSQDKASGGSAPKRTRFTKPTVDEVAEYIEQMGYCINPQRFFDYYESNGWHVGRNPMKDWKASVRSWQRRETGEGGVNAEVGEYASRL